MIGMRNTCDQLISLGTLFQVMDDAEKGGNYLGDVSLAETILSSAGMSVDAAHEYLATLPLDLQSGSNYKAVITRTQQLPVPPSSTHPRTR